MEDDTTTSAASMPVAVLENDTPASRAFVAKELQRLKNQHINYIRMWSEAGLTRKPGTSTRLNRFINNPTSRGGLSTVEFQALARWVWDKGPSVRSNLSAAAEDPLYFAMLQFLDIKRFSEENFAIETPGRYKMYRPAVMLRGRIVEGYIKVWLDKKSNALKTYEVQRYVPVGKSGTRTEVYEGYLFRKSDRVLIVSRQKGRKTLQVINFTGEERTPSGNAEESTWITTPS